MSGGVAGGDNRNLQVDPAKMAQGKTLVEAASHEVKGYLNTMQTEVDELLHGWQSQGADGFRKAHGSWTEKATIINTALDDLGRKLGGVGVQSGAADSEVHSSFNPFSV